MENPIKNTFDAQASLSRVGVGKTILEFQKGQNVFEQGDVADGVYYLQQGKVKITVLSDQGKEAVVGILERGQFFGESCLTGHNCVSPPPLRWNVASSLPLQRRR